MFDSLVFWTVYQFFAPLWPLGIVYLLLWVITLKRPEHNVYTNSAYRARRQTTYDTTGPLGATPGRSALLQLLRRLAPPALTAAPTTHKIGSFLPAYAKILVAKEKGGLQQPATPTKA